MTPGFEALMAAIDYPMYVVTATSEGESSGCLVGFTTQSSIDPPRFLVCLSRANRTFRVAEAADYLAVHLVPATRPDIAVTFGALTGDDVDKLELCQSEPGPYGLPIVSGCPNWFVGRIISRVPLGDHSGFLLEPESAGQIEDVDALSIRDIDQIEPGHQP